jgi:putative ABC transport system ATP-binding protein
MSIIEIEALVKEYGEGDSLVRAVDNVSFSIEEGDFVSILGPSGSGKSTMLHMIGGVDVPTTGSIIIGEKKLQEMSPNELTLFRRKNIGLIYQFYNLVPVLTVEENIALPLLLGDGNVDKGELSDLIERLGLSRRRKHLPSELSGGQQQRVSIGRALITHPKVILADEPTGNLDKKTSIEIMQLLDELNKEKHQTIVLITHDIDTAMYSDRILMMEDGRIVKDYRRRDQKKQDANEKKRGAWVKA